jgi:hypothetical protein
MPTEPQVRRRRPSFRVALFALLTAACAYDAPDDVAVREAFLKENAGVVITSVDTVYPNMPPGERGGDIVHKHIRFRAPSSVECEVVWKYTDGVPEWTLSYKSPPSVAGTLCDGCTMKPCPAGAS